MDALTLTHSIIGEMFTHQGIRIALCGADFEKMTELFEGIVKNAQTLESYVLRKRSESSLRIFNSELVLIDLKDDLTVIGFRATKVYLVDSPQLTSDLELRAQNFLFNNPPQELTPTTRLTKFELA